MFYSLKGYVDLVSDDYIVLDVHDVCYQIVVSHCEEFYQDQQVKVYIYQVVREDEQYLIGFKTLEEKEIFLSLITVKGIGPRTAINALRNTTPDLMKSAILESNVKYLKKLPGIGAKAAAQIILDLKGELSSPINSEIKLSTEANDAKEALKNLGFKVAQIDKAFQSIDLSLDTTSIIKEALKNMR